MAFQEFFCNPSTGANINAGDLTANGVVTSTNGAFSTVTNIFTATSGTPFSGVTANVDYVSLYADGATVATYGGLVTAIGGGGLTLTISSTIKWGTAPTTAGTGISATTGGAWKGPNAAVKFPIGSIAGTATDLSGNYPRVNLKNNATYSITAELTGGPAGPVWLQGYTTTAGDGGKAIIDGGNPGVSFQLLNLHSGANSKNWFLVDMIFQNNGTSGTGAAAGVIVTIACQLIRCVINNIRGTGFFANAYNASCVECEWYACNTANSANDAAVKLSADSPSGTFIRCNFHDNTGSNGKAIHTFFQSDDYGQVHFEKCIFDTNTKCGIFLDNDNNFTQRLILTNCEFYNNGIGVLSNYSGSTFSHIYAENCNFVKNGTYGVSNTGYQMRGYLINCGFPASGTTANGTADTLNVNPLNIQGSITIPANTTPWVDPDNGDFRITAAVCKGTGRGAFTETASSYAGTVGFPDVGAAQSQGGTSGMLYKTGGG